MLREIILDNNKMYEIFQLPCVKSITKHIDGTPRYILNIKGTPYHTVAKEGESIIQNEDLTWEIKR